MQCKNASKICGIAAIVTLGYGIIPTMVGKVKAQMKEKEREKKIYLTFDDGPSAEYTDNLLNLLNEYNIKASFFVVASFAEKNPKIIYRMKMEGHEIGIHSLEHKSALAVSPSYVRYDFKKSMEVMQKLGVDIKTFRPPWGQVNLETLRTAKKYKLKKVLWDVMAEDWRGNTTAEIIAYKLLKRTKNGDIVCLHDGRGSNGAPARTIEALKTVIPIWIKEGYTFHLTGEKTVIDESDCEGKGYEIIG